VTAHELSQPQLNPPANLLASTAPIWQQNAATINGILPQGSIRSPVIDAARGPSAVKPIAPHLASLAPRRDFGAPITCRPDATHPVSSDSGADVPLPS
jgi:hypothetical protein